MLLHLVLKTEMKNTRTALHELYQQILMSFLSVIQKGGKNIKSALLTDDLDSLNKPE